MSYMESIKGRYKDIFNSLNFQITFVQVVFKQTFTFQFQLNNFNLFSFFSFLGNLTRSLSLTATKCSPESPKFKGT